MDDFVNEFERKQALADAVGAYGTANYELGKAYKRSIAEWEAALKTVAEKHQKVLDLIFVAGKRANAQELPGVFDTGQRPNE